MSDVPIRVVVRLVRLPRPPEEYAELAATLAADERAHVAGLRVEADRVRYTVGRGWIRRLLAEHLGADPAAVALTAGPGGRPVLVGSHDTLRFSVSHSEELVAVALAGCALGVDVEAVGAAEPHPRIFAERELTAMGSLPDPGRAALAALLWARKEAAAKAAGSGFEHLPPSQVDALGSPVRVRRRMWYVHDLAVPLGYAGAVVTDVPEVEIDCHDVDRPGPRGAPGRGGAE